MIRRFPAEWEPHWATVLAWPRDGSDWSPWLDAVRDETRELARQILRHERLVLLCPDQESAHQLRDQLVAPGMHELITPVTRYEDTWVRDYGPQAFYGDDGLEMVDFRYNAWGGKFPFETDDGVSRRLDETGLWPTERFRREERLTLEGGALETDGKGSLLVRSSTLLDEQRNPGHDRNQLEALLMECLGVNRVLWLEQGHLQGDDTDGHIDTLARFVDDTSIVYQASTQANNAHLLDDLRRLRDAQGSPYELRALPPATPIYASASADDRLPASYANFLHVQGALLVPSYDQASDEIACRVLEECFPAADVIPVRARTLIEQFGSLHCATLHIPAPMGPTP